MFSKWHGDRVREAGFTVVPDVISKETIQAWRTSLDRLVQRQHEQQDERTRVDDYMVHNPMLLDPVFFDALEHPAIVSVMDELLSPTSILYAFTTSSMPAHGTNYSNRIHVDCPRVIPDYITNIGIIIALDDFTDDNGATYFLPHSFERVDPPTREEFFANAQRAHPRAGDIVAFNARTWHLGGDNTTDCDRHALTLNACRSYMRQRFDYPRMIDNERADSLSPALRRILGFNVRVPASLDEYYLPEEQRLYLSGQG